MNTNIQMLQVCNYWTFLWFSWKEWCNLVWFKEKKMATVFKHLIKLNCVPPTQRVTRTCKNVGFRLQTNIQFNKYVEPIEPESCFLTLERTVSQKRSVFYFVQPSSVDHSLLLHDWSSIFTAGHVMTTEQMRWVKAQWLLTKSANGLQILSFYFFFTSFYFVKWPKVFPMQKWIMNSYLCEFSLVFL